MLCLGEDRRRVLENARANERRNNPDGMERRNETEMSHRDRGGDEWRRRRLVIIARANQRHRAFVLGCAGVWVNQLVPPGRCAENERGKETGATESRDQAAKCRAYWLLPWHLPCTMAGVVSRHKKFWRELPRRPRIQDDRYATRPCDHLRGGKRSVNTITDIWRV